VFSYSLIDGSYIWGTDQDPDEYNTTGMNVGFYAPNEVKNTQYEMLDTTYTLVGNTVAWLGALMPYDAIVISAGGTYERDDDYGKFDADYHVDKFFTPEGYLLAETWVEYDEGRDKETGRWSEFKWQSFYFITSSSFNRQFNWLAYFSAYWLYIIILYFFMFIVYTPIRWKPRSYRARGKKVDPQGLIFVQRSYPAHSELAIKSEFSDLIPSFIKREKEQKSMIVYAHNGLEILGIGFIDKDGKVGTFFGSYFKELINFTRVTFAFIEKKKVSVRLFKNIEKYDIFKVENIQEKQFNYEASLIKPITKEYKSAIVRLIANQDHGRKSARYAKWVPAAIKHDVGVMATTSRHETWVQDALRDTKFKDLMNLQTIGDEILLGVGFMTLGEETGWQYGLYVHPAFRNSKIGRTLVMARYSTLQELGYNTAIAELADWNSPIRRIYQLLDAKKVGKMILIGKKMPKVKIRRH
jgi:GNAT superfamily N-acetyltransferase